MIGSNFFILSVHLSSFYLNIVIRLSECVWRRLVPFLWSGGIKHSSLVPFLTLNVTNLTTLSYSYGSQAFSLFGYEIYATINTYFHPAIHPTIKHLFPSISNLYRLLQSESLYLYRYLNRSIFLVIKHIFPSFLQSRSNPNKRKTAPLIPFYLYRYQPLYLHPSLISIIGNHLP